MQTLRLLDERARELDIFHRQSPRGWRSAQLDARAAKLVTEHVGARRV
jgi:hypothetical protein